VFPLRPTSPLHRTTSALDDEEVVPLQPGTTTPGLFEQTVFAGVTRLLHRFLQLLLATD
jgi:hypothetical protein